MQLGGFLGDFVKGRLKGENPEVERGIRLHRAIDVFTDQHAVVTQSRTLFPENFRRYSGIMLDIIFDHILAQRWPEYYSEALNDYSERTLAQLIAMDAAMPERAAQTLERMHAYNSLARYGECAFIKNSFEFIAGRLRRDNPLRQAYAICLPQLPVLYERFDVFYPEVIDFCDEWKNNQ